MLNSIRKRADQHHSLVAAAGREHGFTLIELLVVILIIGILAAIAIPSFLNQRQKGQDACAKSMARTMETGMETFYIENSSYATATIASLGAIENNITGGKCGATSTVVIGNAISGGTCDVAAPTASTYCVVASSASGNTFALSRASTGLIRRTCATASVGGCVPGGTW